MVRELSTGVLGSSDSVHPPRRLMVRVLGVAVLLGCGAGSSNPSPAGGTSPTESAGAESTAAARQPPATGVDDNSGSSRNDAGHGDREEGLAEVGGDQDDADDGGGGDDAGEIDFQAFVDPEREAASVQQGQARREAEEQAEREAEARMEERRRATDPELIRSAIDSFAVEGQAFVCEGVEVWGDARSRFMVAFQPEVVMNRYPMIRLKIMVGQTGSANPERDRYLGALDQVVALRPVPGQGLRVIAPTRGGGPRFIGDISHVDGDRFRMSQVVGYFASDQRIAGSYSCSKRR